MRRIYLHDVGEAREFAKKLARQVRFAEHINAHKLIVASPSRFPEDKSVLIDQLPEESTVEIEWWDLRRFGIGR